MLWVRWLYKLQLQTGSSSSMRIVHFLANNLYWVHSCGLVPILSASSGRLQLHCTVLIELLLIWPLNFRDGCGLPQCVKQLIAAAATLHSLLYCGKRGKWSCVGLTPNTPSPQIIFAQIAPSAWQQNSPVSLKMSPMADREITALLAYRRIFDGPSLASEDWVIVISWKVDPFTD